MNYDELTLTEYDRVLLSRLSVQLPEEVTWELDESVTDAIRNAIIDADKAIRGALHNAIRDMSDAAFLKACGICPDGFPDTLKQSVCPGHRPPKFWILPNADSEAAI